MLSGKSMKFIQIALTLGLASFVSAEAVMACSANKTGAAPLVARQTPSLVDIAASEPSFSTLVTALKAAGLTDVLDGSQEFTVFAPTNDAFAALPPGTLESLLKPENKDTLAQILTYHVVPGRLPSTALSNGSFKTVLGKPVVVNVMEGVSVDNAQVIQADVKAGNGVIHVIDQVLIPTH